MFLEDLETFAQRVWFIFTHNSGRFTGMDDAQRRRLARSPANNVKLAQIS